MEATSTTTPWRDTELPEENHGFEYDAVVIGGGSGGLACSKWLADRGKKTAVLDFVRPSPQGTTWGLGGTCVNVGCIPKRLMHQSALLGDAIRDARTYGWKLPEDAEIKHDWATLVQGVQDHIGSINWGYRVELRTRKVQYINAYGTFVGPHTLECTDRKGKKTTITSRRFILAMGGRPRYPTIPGAQEYCITSDDIFSLPHPPGKTLVVGASYVALECAGFLTGLGFDTTVMIRSIPLRGFDQQMAEMIVDYMSQTGTHFVRNAVPTKVEKLEDGRLKVTWSRKMGDFDLGEADDIFDTVVMAIGRNPETVQIGLDKLGVKLNRDSKVIVNQYDQTNIPHIYAIGDIVAGGLELTPVAIMAGRLLADRISGTNTRPMDYVNVPTTVFTPIEYGSVGLSEEAAIEKHGEKNIRVYHSYFKPLEWTIPHRGDNVCYMKVICLISEEERVIGFHILAPNSGEITQAVGLGVRLGAKKHDFDMLVGIHPTVAEEMTQLTVSKDSGKDPRKSGC